MRTKLLSSIVLGTMALAGVASADPFVRDHRAQPAITVQPAVSFQANLQTRYRAPIFVDHRYDAQPTTYGYQISANGQWAQGYTYGNDPYVEGIARGEWFTLNPCVELQGQGATRVNLNNHALRTIELQATRGGANLTRIGIQYSDGSHGQLRIDRSLDVSHAPNLRIDLGAQGRKGIAAIVVYGQGNSSFRVLGA